MRRTTLALLALCPLLLGSGTPKPPPNVLPYGNPAGLEIKKGILIDITRAGFQQFTELVSAVIPETVPVDTSSFGQQGDLFDVFIVKAEYRVDIRNVYVDPDLDRLDIIPEEGPPIQQGADLRKNGSVNIAARLSADVSNKPGGGSCGSNPGFGPACVDVEVFGTIFFFFDVTLIDDTCELSLDKNDLGDIVVATFLSAGGKKNRFGQVGRDCREEDGEVCGDPLPTGTASQGNLCPELCDPEEVVCANTNFQCCNESLDDDRIIPDLSLFPPGFNPGLGTTPPPSNRPTAPSICQTDPATPQTDMLCFEPEYPSTSVFQVDRVCNGYIEPYVDIGNVEVFLPEFDVFDVLNIDCGGFLDFLITLVQALPGLIDVNRGVQELLADLVEPTIDETIADLKPTLQEAIDRELWIEQSLDLLGTPLELKIGPGEMYVNEQGLRLELWSKIGASRSQPHPCVSPYIGALEDGSRRTVPPTGTTFPELGAAFAGLTAPPQIALALDDDVANQALFGVWRDGLLCQTLLGDNLPFDVPGGLSLDQTLLKGFAQGKLDDLLPAPPPGQPVPPLVMVTRPREAPVLEVLDQPGGPTASVALEGFGLDLYTDLDGRLVRIVGLDLGGDLAADVSVNYNDTVSPATLSLGVGFDIDAVQPTPNFGDLVPEATEPIANGLGTIVRTVAGGLLDDLLGDLISFEVPEIFGFGIGELFVGATGGSSGEAKDYLGVYGTIEPKFAPGQAVGCDALGGGGGGIGGCGGTGGGGGCGGTGGGGGGLGCSTVPTRMATVLGLPLLVAVFRRRRHRFERA